MEQAWMLFKSEAGDVHYFWNGVWPICVNCPKGEDADYYWNGNPPDELLDSEIKLLNEIAEAKRKKIFTVPGRLSRYIVVERGIFKID